MKIACKSLLLLGLAVLVAGVGALYPAQAYADGAEATQVYRIESGDTLSGIAEKFYHDFHAVRLLVQANHLTNPDLIIAGSTLMIPAAPAYAEADAPTTEEHATGNQSEARDLASTVASAVVVEEAPPVEDCHEQVSAVASQEKGDHLDASATAYHELRLKDPQCVAAWIGEMRVERKLGKNKEAQRVGQDFAKLYDGLRELPFIRLVLSGSSSTSSQAN